MKKPSTWAGIIGTLLIVIYMFGGVKELLNPTNLHLVNVATSISNLLWVAFGGFLVSIYFKAKRKEDAGHEVIKFSPDSPEDIERLNRRRSWIFALFLMVEILGSIEGWILNDYTAGLTLINVGVILDLFFNIIFIYIIIHLLNNRKNVLNILLCVVTLYSLMWAYIDFSRGYKFGAISAIFVAIYFIYAIKMPVNRKNFRNAHLILLPIVLIFTMTFTDLDDRHLTELSKNENLLEQQFSDQTDVINADYSRFLEKEFPDKIDIQNTKDSITKRDDIIEQIILSVENIKKEYTKRLPSIEQKETLEKYRYFLLTIENNKEQTDKLLELMNYADKVNFRNLSEKQKSEMNSLRKQLDDFTQELTKIQFEWSNANLDN